MTVNLNKVKNMCGIYLIENKLDGKKYVGQSRDIAHRWSNHLSRYNQTTDKEYNKVLYRAFRKYGIDNFAFSVLEECDENKLNEREVYWIKTLNTLTENGLGYNVNANFQPELGGATGENHPNHRLTQEDVIDIRTRYNNRERCKEVWELYKDKVGWSGFSKVWKGSTWTKVMMEVYTQENKEFHRHNTGQKGTQNGRSLITEKEVRDIREKKKMGISRKEVFTEYQEKFNLKQGGFDSIWYNITWKDIIV